MRVIHDGATADIQTSTANCQMRINFQMTFEFLKLNSTIPLTRHFKDLQQVIAVFEHDDVEVGDTT